MEKPEGIDAVLESEPLKEHGLRFAGIGASRLVFETAASEDKLVKVDRFQLKRALTYLAKFGSVPSEEYEFQKKDFQEYKEQEDALAAHFGQEHMLRKGAFRFNVPITREIAAVVLEISEEEAAQMFPEEVVEVKMLIETQEKAPELADKRGHWTSDLQVPLMRYSEFRKQPGLVDRLADLRAFLDKSIEHEIAEWKQHGVEATAPEIIERAIAYTKETGRMVDVFGGYNITMFRDEDGELDYHVIDPVLPGPREHWEATMAQDPAGEHIRHSYSYYYGMNKIAETLGLNARLELEDLIYFKGADKAALEEVIAAA